MLLTTLSENTASRLGISAEWGLSMLLEIGELKILFDTGYGLSILHNASFLGKDLSQIDKIVLSHGHCDHTGGLRSVLEQRREVEVISSPYVLGAKYLRRRPEERYRYVGIPFRKEELEGLGAKFVFSDNPLWLSENVVITGEIPLTNEWERIEPVFYIKDGEEFHPDPLKDDRAIIIKGEKGLIVVLGCAHRGAINTISYAQKLTGEERVYAVIGGFHLFTATEEQIERTIAELKGLGVQKVGVSHCTGFMATMRMAQEFGEGFFPNNAGTTVRLN